MGARPNRLITTALELLIEHCYERWKRDIGLSRRSYIYIAFEKALSLSVRLRESFLPYFLRLDTYDRSPSLCRLS